jgi:hypothetical protein
MSATIGEVNINLRMSLAQFKRDVKEGTSEASRNTKQMASEMSGNTHEARGALMLLGEEIGVHIPRHLQGFITKIPGVGTALNAAFSSVAILALIEVIVKITEKITEFRKHAEESAEAMRKAGDIGRESMHKIDEELLTLDAQLEELNGNYLAALRDKLREIDNENLDAITAEFDKLKESADKALEGLKSGFFQNLLELGKGNAQIDGITKNLNNVRAAVKNLAEQGDKVAIGHVLEKELELVNKQIEKGKGNSDAVGRAFQFERQQIETMIGDYDRLNKKASEKKEIEKIGADNKETERILAEAKARQELTDKVRKLSEATVAMITGEKTAADVAIQKYEEQIQKLKDLQAEREREFPGIKTFYGQQISDLEKKLALMRKEKAEQEELFNKGIIPGLQAKAPDLGFGNGQKPVFSGTKEAQELNKLQTDNTAAIAEAQKVFTSTRTAQEQLREETAIYNTLLKEGRIDQQTYNRAVFEAKQRLDANTIAEHELGQAITQNVEQALLMGRSWSDALKAILVEIVKVIIQMTILNRLKQQSGGIGGGGGFGGFFGSLLGGLFGGKKAKGGPVTPGHFYEWKENGHEFFAPTTPGVVIPAMHTQPQAQAVTYNHVVNVNTPDADSFQKSKAQISADAYEQMASAHARNRR